LGGEEYKQPYPECVKVPKKSANRFLKIAKSIVSREYWVDQCGDNVCIPVSDADTALNIAGDNGIKAELCTHVFKPRERRPPSLKEVFPDLDLHSYVIVGDIVVFHPRAGTPTSLLAEAAEYLVSERGYRSVYMKLETTGVERKARLELLAGEDNPVTILKEYGIEFIVDLSKAYVNPRLGYERRRIALQVRPRELVLDLFAGVGGHAIHIAHLVPAEIVAVDINPHAVELLGANIRRNTGKLKGLIHPIHADAQTIPEMIRRRFDRIISDNPTMHDMFIGVECSLSRKGTIIHHYMVAGDDEDPRGLIEVYREHGCIVGLVDYRRVLPYSPRRSIWGLTLRVDKLLKQGQH
jgi:tRNA (guanine37-N1)-methyltransferase